MASPSKPPAANLLRELLAVIHGDGGHYADEHGPEKATEDAIEIFLRDRQTLRDNAHRFLSHRSV